MEKTYYWQYDQFEIALTKQDIMDCSHQGPCDYDCERVRNKPYVQEQLKAISIEQMAHELDERLINHDVLLG